MALRRLWLPAAFLVGCKGPLEGEEDGLRTLADSAVTDRDGIATFSIPAKHDDAVLMTFSAEDPNFSYVHRVRKPNGAVVFDAEALWEDVYSVSNGAFPDDIATVNWPALPDDELTSGDWEVDVGVVDRDYYYVDDVSVVMDAQLKDDADLDNGVLKIDLIYTQEIISDEEVVAALEEAVAYWEDLYKQVGIAIEVETWNYPDIASLPPPGMGATGTYEGIAEETPFRAVNVVIVPQLEGTNGLYGMAGGIPGPLLPTGFSAVSISTEMHMGPDLQFSSGEIGILGETMAHEVGHFVGLFHPVESTYDQWDSLDDTPECFSEASCIDNLGSNLMFPYPVCDQSGNCIAQDWVSSSQGKVAERYTAVE